MRVKLTSRRNAMMMVKKVSSDSIYFYIYVVAFMTSSFSLQWHVQFLFKGDHNMAI